MLDRHSAVGLAVGVLNAARFDFVGHGFADVGSQRRITEDTVFRIGSITKTMTAVAVMQLWELGMVDLDVPASDYLRAYRLVMREPVRHPPAIRHLLTHTSGIPDVRRIADLLHFTWGSWDARPPVHSVPFGQKLPSLAEHYCDGLEVVAEPGSAFAYSNPAFATLGQIVEDVSGLPLDRYLRERIFEPLGMEHTDLLRRPDLADLLATGYASGRRGPRRVPDRDWIGGGGGGAYSTPRDLALYAEALLGGGENEHGRILKPETLAMMFERQYQTAPDLPAMGLGFFRTDVGGHRILGHDGILPGFNSHLALAPDDGAAVLALTNGSSGAMRWIPAETERLLRELLCIPDQDSFASTPPDRAISAAITGRYVLPPRIGDMRGRLVMGGGLEVFVRGNQPMLRLRIPFSPLWRGVPLQRDDAHDPRSFRIDLARFGMGEVRLRFRTDPGTGSKVIHTDVGGQPISFVGSHSMARAPVMIDRLGAEDQLMLAASRTWPQDVGALLMLDGTSLFDGHRFRIDAVRATIASRLPLVPRLHQVIRTAPPGRGGPYWADAQSFDVSRHVEEIRLEPPVGEGQLLDAVEKQRARRFERRHPLWRMSFLTGLPEGRVALYVKLHHAVADGLAAMTIVSAFLDSEPGVVHPPPRPWMARRGPRASQLVGDNLRRRVSEFWQGAKRLARPWFIVATAGALLPAMRELLAETPGDPTDLDCLVGGTRRLALVRARYRTIRRIGRSCGASANDVLLAATSAGLRALFVSRGQPVEGVTIRAYVPVSLRRRLRGPQQGTNIAQMVVPLSLSEATPVERLRRIAAETTVRKARRRPAVGSLFRGRLVTRILLGLVMAQRVNVTTASIPGPRRPMYLAGARIREVFPVLPLIGNQPVGVGAVSYADTFDFGITVDGDAVPDLEAFASGVRQELEALSRVAGESRFESAEPTRRRTRCHE